MDAVQRYVIRRGAGIDGLSIGTAAPAALAPREVRIRIHAAALNYRDLLVARGQMGSGEQRVPLSDAAGEVIEVGAGVTRAAVGDRVIPTFFPQWLEGDPVGDALDASLGGTVDGVLGGQVVAHEDAVVLAPSSLTWVEASTIACAGVTAWHALHALAPMQPGQHVLVQGTGGVSTWALQLARAMGLEVTVLSGSADKLGRAKALGAHHLIDYTATPDWDAAVQALGGVDRVLDVGGADTIGRAIASTRPGGVVMTIGGVSGGFALGIDPFALIGRRVLSGVVVGSRAMTEDLVRFIDATGLKPVIDSVHPFARAADAYRVLEQQRPFGKVAIDVTA